VLIALLVKIAADVLIVMAAAVVEFVEKAFEPIALKRRKKLRLAINIPLKNQHHPLLNLCPYG